MSDDLPPPTPLPPAAQAPYPAHPAPHATPAPREAGTPSGKQSEAQPQNNVPLATIALIGAGAAAALGLIWSLSRKAAEPTKRPRKGGKPAKSSRGKKASGSAAK